MKDHQTSMQKIHNELNQDVINKLIKLANAIDYIDTDDNNNVYIRFNKGFMISTEGDLVLYSKNGNMVTNHKATYFNSTLDRNKDYERDIRSIVEDSITDDKTNPDSEIVVIENTNK